MILVVTNRRDSHADLVIHRMQERSVTNYLRINTELLPTQIESTTYMADSNVYTLLKYGERSVDTREVTAAWFRRPFPSIVDVNLIQEGYKEYVQHQSESYVRGLWETIDCFWVSRPALIRAAGYKLEQLARALDIGFNIPRTLVTNSYEDSLVFCENLNWNVLVKGISSYIPKDMDMITVPLSRRISMADKQSLSSISLAMVIMQEYIEKSYELRITVIGERLFAVKLDSQSVPEASVDWRSVPAEKLPHEVVSLDRDIESKCMKLIQSYGLKFGTIDMVVTPNDECIFLELNPNGQWVWQEQILGSGKLPMMDTLIDLLLQK